MMKCITSRNLHSHVLVGFLVCLRIDFASAVRFFSQNDDRVKVFTTDFRFSEPVNEPSLQGHEIPNLKMLKRQLRNFNKGEQAAVTLVFHASLPVDVRWYVKEYGASNNAAASEIPNMSPAEDSDRYVVSQMSSGDVTATSLIVPNFNATFKVPVIYECVITTVEGTLQYQIKTIVKKAVSFQLDNIDSPEWMVVPKPTWNFTLNTKLQVKCKVFVPFQKTAFSDELVLSKASPTMSGPKIHFDNIIRIHKDAPGYAEELGTTILQGMRREFRKGHAIYEVRMSTVNTPRSFEGIYLCKIERQFDKMFFISSASMTGHVSPYPSMPRVQLIHCKTGLYTESVDNDVVLVKGEPGCIRCRGIGYPRPDLVVYRGESRVHSDRNVIIKTFTNVADAGVQEAMYIFRNPTWSLAGNYSCRAISRVGEKRVTFRLKIQT